MVLSQNQSEHYSIETCFEPCPTLPGADQTKIESKSSAFPSVLPSPVICGLSSCSVCPVGCAVRVLSPSSGLCREGALSVQWAVQGGWSSQVYILHGDPFPPPSLNPEIQFLPQGFKPEYTISSKNDKLADLLANIQSNPT